MPVRRAYEAKLKQRIIRKDAAQERVVDVLAELEAEVTANRGYFRRLGRRLGFFAGPEPCKGLYLWGGVGRGKTFLMDLLFAELPAGRKRRVHFHRMMREVHARLRALGNRRDPLEEAAREIARDTDVLCFDEFFVSDIGDAMILGRLLEGLFRRGVVFVATSNLPPTELYRGGLQRERFLPAIALLESNTRVLHIGGTADHRLRLFRETGVFASGVAEDDDRLERHFRGIAGEAGVEDATIDLDGRALRVRKRAPGVVWVEFTELCEAPRSARDYIELARWHPNVIVSGVPALTAEKEDAARRFITLIDELYDRRVKLVLSAAVDLDRLYRGRRLVAEFERTLSRLREMQTPRYLHAAHRA